MTPEHWIGMLLGLGLAAVVAVLARIGLTGGGLSREQHCRFVCPWLGRAVECRIVQDMRTAQWKQVASCSAFTRPEAVVCEQDCARMMNMGFRLPQAPPA
jgi:hypothetical protein